MSPGRTRRRGRRGERAAPGGLYAVVLAGGAGERLWPASRAARPKHLLRVAAGRSLLEATLLRAGRFAAPERVLVVCGHEHAAATRRTAGLSARQVLVEPARRNTAMAVGVAATRIAARDPDAVLVVLPADHHIPDAARFARAVRKASRAARDRGALVTLGVRPTRPDPRYGYIRLGDPVGKPYNGLHRVRRFVEKPSEERARRFLRTGDHLWNAGIFVWTARAILEEIETHAPRLHRALAPLRGLAPGGRGEPDAIRRAYRRAPSEPIDVAVLERSRRVWCLPLDCAWSDIGTWESLAESLGVGGDVTRVIEGEVVLCDSGGNLVWGKGRPIALLGVSGLAVVDAGDALLVASLERSGELREVVRRMRRRGRPELL